MPSIRTPDPIVRTICPSCGRVLVDEPGDLCAACALVRHHIRRGESVDGDQRRLEC